MDFRRILLDGAILVLIGIIIVLVIFNVVLSKSKTGFTELYFVGDLPETVDANKTYSFSFAIHNLEYKTTNYEYEIYSDSQRINKGQIILGHNETNSIIQNFAVKSKPINSTKISVNLINKNQEIHFWAK